MSARNIVGINIEASKLKPEETIEMKLDEIKYDNVKTINSLDMKISYITSNNPCFSYEQPSAELTKFLLLKSPDKASDASQFTKHVPSPNFKGNTLLQLQKWWDENQSAFCQSLLKKNR